MESPKFDRMLYRNLLSNNVAFGTAKGEATALKEPSRRDESGASEQADSAAAPLDPKWEEMRRAREAYEARQGQGGAAEPASKLSSRQNPAVGSGALPPALPAADGRTSMPSGEPSAHICLKSFRSSPRMLKVAKPTPALSITLCVASEALLPDGCDIHDGFLICRRNRY